MAAKRRKKHKKKSTKIEILPFYESINIELLKQVMLLSEQRAVCNTLESAILLMIVREDLRHRLVFSYKVCHRCCTLQLIAQHADYQDICKIDSVSQ